MQTATINKYLTETEAAAMLGLSPKTLQGWRWRTGKGNPTGPRFHKFNTGSGNCGAVRYAVADLEAFAGQHIVEGCVAR